MAFGYKTGGAVKGSKHKRNHQAEVLLARFTDPRVGMAMIAAGEVDCGTCHGKGVTKYQPAKGSDKLLERTCESCYGSKLEKISPELKGKMFAELAKYKYPQLRAIEHSGTIEGQISVADVLRERFKKRNGNDGEPS